MTENQQNELLEKFINDSPLSEHIRITVGSTHKSFKPKNPDSKAYYEDCTLLASILSGAEHFCYWLRRNGYKITSSKKEKNK